MYLIEVINPSACLSCNSCGDTDRCAVLGYILKHHRVGGDLTVVLYYDRTKYLGARAYEDVVAECGVSLAEILTRTSKGDSLIECTVITDLCRLAYDYACTVVDNESLADSCARMYLDTREELGRLAYCPCREGVSAEVELVRYAIRQGCMQTRIEEKNLYVALCGGVSLLYRLDVILYLFFDLAYCLDGREFG